jgi:hypothetical protein
MSEVETACASGCGGWMSCSLAQSWVDAMRSKYGAAMTHDVELSADGQARVTWTVVDPMAIIRGTLENV